MWSKINNVTLFVKNQKISEHKIDWNCEEKTNQSTKIIKEKTETDYDFSSCLNHDLCIFIQTQEKYDDDNAFHTAYTCKGNTKKEEF